MSRLRSAILVGLAAAFGLTACAAPRAVLMPAPPPEVRKEAGAPSAVTADRGAPAVPPGTATRADAVPGARDAEGARAGETTRTPVAPPALSDKLSLYTEACDRTQLAIGRDAPREAIPFWKAIEDSKWGADAVFNQGVLFQLAGDLDEAAAQYRRAADRSPAFEPPLANLLGIALLRGDRERTRSLLARVVPPGSVPSPEMLPELAVNAATALMETGRRDDAAALLLSLRNRGKTTPALGWNLAVLAFRKGDPRAARDLAGKISSDVARLFPVVASRFAWAEEGEKLPPLGPAPPGMAGMAALSGNLAGYAEYRRGNAAAAEKILASATAGEAVPAEILTNIGILQAEQGRWNEARQSLERAVRENPELPAGWLNLGIFRDIYEGNLPEARECYDNYVKFGGSRKEEVRKWSEGLGRSASPQE